ncbi:MAG: RIP metalloprotease RseP [Candidatus Omnitrophota bacterium]
MSFILFLFILGLLIIVHEFGHFLAAKKMGVKVEKFALGFGPALWKIKKGDTEYSLCAIPLGGYVKMAGDSIQEHKGASDEYLSRPPLQRALIIFLGPLLNYLLGFLCFWMIFILGYPALTTKVGGVIEGLGAKEAGIQAGDRISAIDGKRLVLWEELQKAIQGKKDSSARVLITRGDKEYELDVRITEKKMEDLLGGEHKVGLLGITPVDEFVQVRHGFFKAAFLSARKTLDLTLITYKALSRMVTGRLSMRESVTGPLGIFFITSKAARLGFIAVMHLVAVLSISLAIFNLLPLPVLDGGHILLLGIEKLRKRPFGPKTEHVITQAGLALIILLAVVATYNDLLRFFGDKIFSFLK